MPWRGSMGDSLSVLQAGEPRYGDHSMPPRLHVASEGTLEIRHPRLTVTPSLTCEHSPPRGRLEKTQQTCRHCCGKCCSSPVRSGTPAPGRKRRRSVWLRPSRPVEKKLVLSLSSSALPAQRVQLSAHGRPPSFEQ